MYDYYFSYLACALRTSISSVRYPSHSLDPNVLSSNKNTESSTNTTTTTATTTTDPLKLLLISSILVSLGINQLNQGYYIQRNNISQESLMTANQLDHIIKPFNFIIIPNELFYLSESTLKNALQLLENLSNIYDELLEEIIKEKSLLEPGTITTDDEIEEQDIRDRIALIKKLQSRAWAALAGVYSTSDGKFSLNNNCNIFFLFFLNLFELPQVNSIYYYSKRKIVSV